MSVPLIISLPTLVDFLLFKETITVTNYGENDSLSLFPFYNLTKLYIIRPVTLPMNLLPQAAVSGAAAPAHAFSFHGARAAHGAHASYDSIHKQPAM